MASAACGKAERAPWGRAAAVWLVLIVAEVVHGALRAMLLAPRTGMARAGQIGVFTGCLLNFGIAYWFSPWLGVKRGRTLVAVGALWALLTVIFEVAFGRFVAGASWRRLRADYDLRHGGLLPLGLLALAGSPLLAASLRARGAGGRSP
jgi:hypothetical protein